jgi:hypothetical protein
MGLADTHFWSLKRALELPNQGPGSKRRSVNLYIKYQVGRGSIAFTFRPFRFQTAFIAVVDLLGFEWFAGMRKPLGPDSGNPEGFLFDLCFKQYDTSF